MPTEAHAVRLIPADVAVRLRVVPLSAEGGRLRIALADPFDLHAIDEAGAVARMPLVTDGGEILRAVGDCIREEFAERNEHPEEDDGRDAESCLEAIREWKSMMVPPARAPASKTVRSHLGRARLR